MSLLLFVHLILLTSPPPPGPGSADTKNCIICGHVRILSLCAAHHSQKHCLCPEMVKGFSLLPVLGLLKRSNFKTRDIADKYQILIIDRNLSSLIFVNKSSIRLQEIKILIYCDIQALKCLL
jgi:hypothetical protein